MFHTSTHPCNTRIGPQRHHPYDPPRISIFYHFPHPFPGLISLFLIFYAAPLLSVCGGVFTMELVAGYLHRPQMLTRQDEDSNTDLCPRNIQ